MSMKAGKPAYIEKPMAVTYEECTRINRISNETGVPCFVAYYRRYLPYFQKVKELVENGTIGNIINVQIRFAQPPRDLDYNRDNLPGVCRLTLPEVATSTTLLRIKLICCRICSVVSSKQAVIRAIGVDFILLKIH